MKAIITHFLLFSSFLFLLSAQGFADNKTSASGTNTQTTQENWDPYPELERMRQDFNRLLQLGMSQAGRGLEWAQSQSGVFNPRMDMVEETDRYVVKADIPGMDKSKLDVKVTDTSLTITGERSLENEKTDKDAGIYQQERSFGRFERNLPLPENVQTDEISAKYDLGVLTIELPKITPAAPAPENARKIPVQ